VLGCILIELSFSALELPEKFEDQLPEPKVKSAKKKPASSKEK
jgi:hypothetical protein